MTKNTGSDFMMSRRHQLDINRLAKPQYNQVYLQSKSEREPHMEIQASKENLRVKVRFLHKLFALKNSVLVYGGINCLF